MGIIAGILANGEFYIPTGAMIEGRLPVKTLEGRQGVLCEDGSVIGAIKYDNVLWFNNECIAVSLNGVSLLLDKEGKEFGETFEDVQELYNQLVAGKKNGLWYLIDIRKREKVSLKGYESINYDSGYGWVRNGSCRGVIDMDGREILTPEFEEITVCGYNLFAVRKTRKGLLALADSSGILTGYEYTYIGYFHKGVAKATKKGFWGRINDKGEWITC